MAAAALQTCQNFERILKKSFGPNGLDVMLRSSSGNILITNSGSMILESLTMGNPTERMIVEAARSLSGRTGSGASYFIIILAEIFREIANITGITKEKTLKELSAKTQIELFSFSQAFNKIESERFDDLFLRAFDNLEVRVDLSEDNCELVRKKLKAVINTCLNGKFPKQQRDNLATLLADFLHLSCSAHSQLYQFVLDSIDAFSEICLVCIGAPQDFSHVVEGVMIPQQMSTKTKGFGMRNFPNGFKFIALTFALDECTPETPTTLRITKGNLFDTTLNWKRTNTLKILQYLKMQEIQLIITSKVMSDMVIHLCNQLNIAVIHSIPIETISYICNVLSIQPLQDLNLDKPTLPDIFQGSAKSCSPKIIGNQKYSHLVLGVSEVSAHQIMLCGPAEGLCRQYYLALLDALKAIKMTFSTDRRALLLLPGCGLVEVALASDLQHLSKMITNTELALACQILGKSLLQIPRTLYQNSFAGKQGLQQFLTQLQIMETSWRNSNLSEGIDGRTGLPINPFVHEILEPLLAKKDTLHCVFQCVTQVLRINQVLGVACRPKETVDESDD
ncbi:predicted protein [Nematostella vectensis]|uniref:Uncharacterized protein n=1 Tax=Nematostella vectensis TaxID=45351 RepID=A7RRC2_NEMVE|nr:predicted protein [Nematostella vectensis]|eukprot:XP_001637986.1 predicted protein [Nematostella vectensis]